MQWQEHLDLEKILSVCNEVLLIVTCKQQQKEMDCQLALCLVCQP